MSEAPVIIGLTGRAGSGKSAAARELVDILRPAVRLRFAGPIKEMAHCLGLTEEQVDGGQKEGPLSLICGRSPRFVMQTLGTEWGRNLIGEQLWVNVLMERARINMIAGNSVIVDDVRFPNEVEAINRMGGRVFRIVRPDAAPITDDGHMSERLISSLAVELDVVNDGTEYDMARQIVEVVR